MSQLLITRKDDNLSAVDNKESCRVQQAEQPKESNSSVEVNRPENRKGIIELQIKKREPQNKWLIISG